jgi:hypothetical protein
MPSHCPWLDHHGEGDTMTTYRDRLEAGLHTAPDADQDRTVEDLKRALKTLGQPVSGTKTELEKRLADAQKNA